jgi:hypothetical protein
LVFLPFPFVLVSLLAQQGKGSPDLLAFSPVRDLGRVRPGVRETVVYLVMNQGTQLLNIRELRPECGCLTARASQTRLAPKETSEIRVTFDPPAEEGRVTKALDVITDAPGQEPTRLRLTAEVFADVSLSGNQITFEDLPRDRVGRAQLRLEAHGPGGLKVTALESSAPAYLFVAPTGQGRNIMLDIRLDGSKLPAGKDRGEDWISIQASDPDLYSFHVQVRWTASPAGHSVQ